MKDWIEFEDLGLYFEQEIGSGGNGQVWRAKGSHGQPVAVKVLKIFDNPAQRRRRVARFRLEIALLEVLQAEGVPGLMPVLDSGVLNERPWYSMPLAEKLSLPSDVQAKLPVVLRLSIDVCSALLGMLETETRSSHRDIKPSNILVLDGRITLADFGLAVELDEPAELTVTGEVAGSLAYRAPEAGKRDASYPPLDVFSVGKTVWHLLSGQIPQPGPLTQHQRLADQLEIPVEIDQLLEFATSHDPGSRPTIGELGELFEQVLERHGAQQDHKSIDLAAKARSLFDLSRDAVADAKAKTEADAAARTLQQQARYAFWEAIKPLANELGWPTASTSTSACPDLPPEFQEFQQRGVDFLSFELQRVNSRIYLVGLSRSLRSGHIEFASVVLAEVEGVQAIAGTFQVRLFHDGSSKVRAVELLVGYLGSDALLDRVIETLGDLLAQDPAMEGRANEAFVAELIEELAELQSPLEAEGWDGRSYFRMVAEGQEGWDLLGVQLGSLAEGVVVIEQFKNHEHGVDVVREPWSINASTGSAAARLIHQEVTQAPSTR